MSRSPEVDAYIAALPPNRQVRLTELREATHRAVPGLVESIEWKMPVFRRGEQWFGMSSRAQYTSLYIGEARVARLVAADPRLRHGKACLNIQDSIALPLAAIEAEIADVFKNS